MNQGLCSPQPNPVCQQQALQTKMNYKIQTKTSLKQRFP